MFQDVRMPRKSLKEVLPKKGEAVVKSTKTKHAPVEEEVLPPLPRQRPARRRGWHAGPKLIWVGIIFIVLVAAGFFISKTFSTVLVKVTPKQFTIALNGSAFSAPYESVTIPTIREERVVTAKLTAGVPKKASGTIIVYNNYSANPQALVANTRFEAAGGKIYRLTKAITVPGNSSIAAAVVADQAGTSYNAGLTDFTIPGFKGDPRYTKFSAKSKTAMTGGSAGEAWVVPEAERAKVVAELKQELIKKAAEQIRFQIPNNFIFYENDIVSSFKEEIIPATTSGSGKATLVLFIDAQAIIFEREALSAALVKPSLPNGDNQPFSVTNLDKLAVTIDQNSLKSDSKKLTITANGNAEVEFTVDPEALRQKLVNATAGQATSILSQFSGVGKAKFTFQPPWIRQFPKSPDRIKVELLTSL